MKISEMTNDQATEVLIKITQPLASIMGDAEADKLLKQITESREMSLSKMIGTLLPVAVTFALKSHKKDLYEIVAAFAGKPVKEVGQMNIMKTMEILRDSIDKDFLDFFKSANLGEGTVQDS